jgi:predicted phage terminase large subunit-like protein
MARHLGLLNRELVEAAAGRSRRLMVFMPPRHGKSELISRYFAAWYLLTYPDRRIILTSYEAESAAAWGRKARDLVEEYGPELYGLSIREDSSAANRWDIVGHSGGMVTAGVGGPITGKGAHCLIIDDPIKNWEEAQSPTIREKLWDWYLSTAYTRLEPGGAVIIILTRWHEDDLAGRLLREMEHGGEQWRVISLPAISKEDDPLGREPGEALWPARFSIDDLERIRQTLGSSKFSALYQQDPMIEGGNVVRREWIRYYTEDPHPRRVVQSWDTAYKVGRTDDYSCCTTWIEGDQGYYLKDVWVDRVEYPELQRVARQLYDAHHPHAVLVEDKASGQSLVQELVRETRIPVIPIKVDADKLARAHAVSPLFEAGRVFFREGASWLHKVIEQLVRFPNDKHDDIVDSITQALSYMRGSGTGARVPIDKAVAGPTVPAFRRRW